MGEGEEVLGSEPLRLEPGREVLALGIAPSDVDGRAREHTCHDGLRDGKRDDAASEPGLNGTQRRGDRTADDQRELAEPEPVLGAQRPLVETPERRPDLPLEEVDLASQRRVASKARLRDERLPLLRLPAEAWQGGEQGEAPRLLCRSEPGTDGSASAEAGARRSKTVIRPAAISASSASSRGRSARNDIRDLVGEPPASGKHDDLPPRPDVAEHLTPGDAPTVRDDDESGNPLRERIDQGKHRLGLSAPAAILDEHEVRVMRLERNPVVRRLPHLPRSSPPTTTRAGRRHADARRRAASHRALAEEAEDSCVRPPGHGGQPLVDHDAGETVGEERTESQGDLGGQVIGATVQHEQPARGPEAERRPTSLRADWGTRTVAAESPLSSTGGPDQETVVDRNESTSGAAIARRP